MVFNHGNCLAGETWENLGELQVRGNASGSPECTLNAGPSLTAICPDGVRRGLNGFAAAHDTKFGKLAGPLRAALAGRAVTPSVFDMMLVLGRDETLARLTDAAA